MVLKICKYKKTRSYRDQESMCRNKLLKGYQKVKMHSKTFTQCILTAPGLLLVDVNAARTMLANALEFILVMVMECAHKDVLARSPIS